LGDRKNVRRPPQLLGIGVALARRCQFCQGAPAEFFKILPLPLRLIVPGMVRRKIKETLKLQGFGRHTPAEQNQLAIADADAAVFAFVVQLLVPLFMTPARAAAEKHQNLISYRNRMPRQYFPE
jgi:hypothetical protein